MSLAEKILTLRKKKNLTQEELATELNVTRQAVSAWELGENVPEISTLVKLSEVMGVSLDYLLKEGNDDLAQTPPARESEGRFEAYESFVEDLEDETDIGGFSISLKDGIWPIAILAFLVAGFFDILPWSTAWLIFVVAWIVEEIVDWFRTGRLSISIYSVAGLVFLAIGFLDIVSWSRAWLVFVAAWAIDAIFIEPNRKRRKKRKKRG